MRERKKKRVTISDVALEAGVSIAAVSRILNNSYEGFSAREETKQRVYDAVKKLGYRPSRAAVTLATGRRNTIALCHAVHEGDLEPIPLGSLEKLFQHFEMTLAVNGIRRAIEPEQMDLVLMPARKNRTPEEFAYQVQDKVDAIVWVNPEEDSETLQELVKSGVPVAVVGAAPFSGNFVNVRADEATAGRMAAGHLLVRGARNILVAMPRERQTEIGMKERLEGIERAAEDFPNAKVEIKTLRLPSDGEKAKKAVAAHLDKSGIPDAVIALDSHLPFPILHELYERDYEVPHDVLLVGFEENPLYQVNYPAITGLRYPTEQMCFEAAKLLLKLLDSNQAPPPVWVTPQMIARASCP